MIQKLGASAADEEFAPGIPSKEVRHELPTVRSPTPWEFTLHRHDATARGLHFDARLGDPETGHAHSWAMPPSWPKPGQSVWVVAQPSHTLAYLNFTGTIPKGTYGAGTVSIEDRGRAEVMRAEPGHVAFNLYRGSGPEELVLHRVNDKIWRLTNRTFQRSDVKSLPSDKPDYRSTTIPKIDVSNDAQVLSAKLDDAHNLFVFPAGGKVRVVSYRDTDRPSGVIEHTHKVPGLLDVKVPPQLRDTILRGGLYATDASGAAVPNRQLGGILNASVWKSREQQEQIGKLRPVIYDVARFRGKDLSRAPYREKLEALKKVQEHLPVFELPRMAWTAGDKRRLLEEIQGGRVPETREGVVVWDLDKAGPPTKAKNMEEHDVQVARIFPGEGKYRRSAGGFEYSHEPGGPIVGRSGTGLSDAMRADMWKNPDRYVGLVARVTAHERFPSGALRVPAFQGWHLDKNAPERLQGVEG